MDDASIIEVTVAPGPLGILLNGDDPATPALLEGFAPISTDGDRGDVEKDGRVRAGAQLVGVNEYDFAEWKLSFAEIGQVLRETSDMQRVLRFRVPAAPPAHVASSSFRETASIHAEASPSPRSVAEPALATVALSPAASSSAKPLASSASVTFAEGTHNGSEDNQQSPEIDRASRLVAVNAPAGPLGLDLDGNATDRALLLGFVPLPDGSSGAVQLSGDVVPGSTLVEVNGEDVSALPLSEITAMLGALSGEPRQLVFLLPDPAELARLRGPLLKKSSRSMPRYVEDLEMRRKLELALVLRFDGTKLKRRECWMLLDAEWMNKWVAFAARGGDAPGPVTNDALLDEDWEDKHDGKIPGRPDTPREGLEVTKHYRGVTPMVWCLFLELHGMNPKLPVLARYKLDIYAEPPRKSDLAQILTECRLKAASLVLELRDKCEVRVDG